jgi:hypothetical protein
LKSVEAKKIIWTKQANKTNKTRKTSKTKTSKTKTSKTKTSKTNKTNKTTKTCQTNRTHSKSKTISRVIVSQGLFAISLSEKNSTNMTK